MDFACPHDGCGQPVSLHDASCPHCHQPLTLGAILGLSLRGLWRGVRRQARVACPQCGQELGLSATTCPDCAAPVAFEDTLDRLLAPLRARWAAFKAGADPSRQRRVQWAHLILSGLILWLLVSYVADHRAADWLWHLGLSAVYLAVLAFLTALIAPAGLFRMISRWGWRVKIGLTFNYFTLLLVLQIFIGTFWKRAVTLALLFAVTYVAFLLLRWFLTPIGEAFASPSTQFDPAAPQGRRARYD
jgi:hypothetical protein